MIVFREEAQAKINLYLHVTGRYANGFHELDSWVAFAASGGDALEAVAAPELSLAIEGRYADAVPEHDNSVLRAARALAGQYGINKGGALRLHKRLPVAAGIGGGTADAAATLRLLSRVWGIPPSLEELSVLGATLGSDVPACVYGCSLYMNGAGERITPAATIAQWPVVLVNPGVPLATQEVFAALTPPYSTPMRHPNAFASLDAAIQFLQQARNDLQPAAVRLMPVIAEVLAFLGQQQGALLARMSGSGATCFGIYKTRQDAHNAAMSIGKQYPGWWVQESVLQ